MASSTLSVCRQTAGQWEFLSLHTHAHTHTQKHESNTHVYRKKTTLMQNHTHVNFSNKCIQTNASTKTISHSSTPCTNTDYILTFTCLDDLIPVRHVSTKTYYNTHVYKHQRKHPFVSGKRQTADSICLCFSCFLQSPLSSWGLSVNI